ncbi:LRR receptor-like serine/threonine-protein kinase GSO2 [Vigna radiata var. radiata]|uniref:LRR receptor-like serine/threonine-protein kinase GSO2 n=1 Tax=Vigna radiata var. radiata TaxID=3916 RepID=A0A1S3U137_VIGRR|nr:LRR receptor-like serine/threonine-protein kinase GSO2 [Vigna radiata var. radiata]
MNSYFLKISFAVFVCILHNKLFVLGFNSRSQSSQVKCIERERQALLNFKQGVQDYYGVLSTWRNDENDTDCCRWKGIECNNETGHVEMVDLRGSKSHYLSGSINITSLVGLHKLEYLDLSSNYPFFDDGQIPPSIGSFQSLRYLNLSFSTFFGTIPYELGNLSKLEYLDLKETYIHGEIPSQLGKLSSMRYLDLSLNFRINGEIPSQLGSLSHLRYLYLSGNSLSGALPFQVGNLPLLHSLRLDGNFGLKIKDENWLSSLSSLTTLSLDCFPYLGISNISEHLPNLRELSLDYCALSDADISLLFPSHSNISTSLSILSLSNNKLTSLTFQLLSNYSPNLQELYLSANNIVLSSPNYLNFPSLLILDLSSNNLTQTSIFQEHLNFSTKLQQLTLFDCGLTDKSFLVSSSYTKNSLSLVTLVISNNLLKSPVVFHWVCNFTANLQSLFLENNLLEGPIPDGFGKVMNSLKLLKLNYNKLRGEIPASLGYVYQLQSLHLEENYLEGDINELHLTNLSQLIQLDLSDNSLSLNFATTWTPPFQLRKLGLASCKLGPNFPSWLQTQSQLEFLDISDAGIDDFVPNWFWNNLQFISEMNMSSNGLKGVIPNLTMKSVLYGSHVIILNSNKLEGVIPIFLSHARILDLSRNNFSDLNTLLCGNRVTKNMYTLDLSNNQIGGQLPECWEHLSSLEFLDLRNNKLSGKIPQSMSTLVNLQALVLRNNNLNGELPLTLKKCSNLAFLDVSKNLLSGPIPSWIGENMQQLKILSLRVNNFFGSVPKNLCYLSQIHVLDLSKNNLSGEIPTCLRNFTTLSIPREIVRIRKISSQVTYYDLYDSYLLLAWKGQDHEFWNPKNLLRSIDLSSNSLTGEVPTEIGYLLGLVSLNLSRNNFYGEIPSEIGNLSSLEFLDLSRNNFSGNIPSTLPNIDSLGVLDLSNNNFSGRIPWGRHFETFDASCFEGNINLCGEQLNKSCPREEIIEETPQPAIDGEEENSNFYGALYMSLGLGFFVGFWGSIGSMLLWQPWRIAYMRFLNRLIDYVLVMTELNVTKCHRWLKG